MSFVNGGWLPCGIPAAPARRTDALALFGCTAEVRRELLFRIFDVWCTDVLPVRIPAVFLPAGRFDNGPWLAVATVP